MFSKPLNRWWMVVAGTLANAVGVGVVAAYVLGVFTKSISAEFGWERSYATAGLSCLFVISGFGTLALGALLTKWPIRRVTMLFVVIFALSLIAIGFMPKSFLLFCILYSCIGFFGAGATAMPYAIAISSKFDSNRGLALAIMVSGAGVGGLLMPSYASWLMGHYGWRGGYIGIGLLVGIVALVSLVLFFRSPPVPQLKEGGLPPPSFGEIIRSSRAFWLISLPIFGISIALVGLTTNLIPILTDRGITPTHAAKVVGLLGAASWISRFGIGILLDRIHAKYIASGIFLVSAVGTLIIAVSGNSAGIYLAAILLGLGLGSEADLITFTVSRYYPAEALSRAMGAVWIFWAWGNGIGVFLASLSYDLTGDYSLAFLLFGGLALLSTVLILQLGPYTYPVRHGADNAKNASRGLRQQEAPSLH